MAAAARTCGSHPIACRPRLWGATPRCDALPLLRALGLIHVPTMLIAGEHDSVAPPAQMEAMAAAITGAQCVPVPHSGHLPHLERPEEFDTLLLDFLRHAKAWLH